MDQGRARALTAAALVAVLSAPLAARAEEEPRFPVAFSGSALYWNGGEFRATRSGSPTLRPEVGPDLALKIAVDVALADHLEVGATALATAPRDGLEVPLAQAALAARAPFRIGREVVIEPGLEVGWRVLQEARDVLGRSSGLALDADVRLSVDKDLGVVPFCEFGFLSQPSGGRGGLTVVFSPIMFVGGGLRF